MAVLTDGETNASFSHFAHCHSLCAVWILHNDTSEADININISINNCSEKFFKKRDFRLANYNSICSSRLCLYFLYVFSRIECKSLSVGPRGCGVRDREQKICCKSVDDNADGLNV